jgi:hypothetical protein
MTNRELAINWWKEIDDIEIKTNLVDKYFFVGRSPYSITGREIQEMYMDIIGDKQKDTLYNQAEALFQMLSALRNIISVDPNEAVKYIDDITKCLTENRPTK